VSAENIIIIKKKKGGHGHAHHGGAWKVAYADFVTAMMAFFLLMWLLNATTENQRKGIADYFDPRIPISRVSGGGTDMFGGDSIFTSEQLAQNGAGGNANQTAEDDEAKDKRNQDMPPEAQHRPAQMIDPDRQRGTLQDSEVQGDAKRFAPDGESAEAPHPRTGTGEGDAAGEAKAQAQAQALAEAIQRKVQERADYNGLDKHLIFKATEEGLRIEVVDRDGAPMFESGNADSTPRMQALVQVIAEVVRETSAKVALTGHTDAIPFATPGRYGNWELSTDRAHAARRLLVRHGVGQNRIQRVEGLADTVPLLTENPKDPRNRRIGIVILRGDR